MVFATVHGDEVRLAAEGSAIVQSEIAGYSGEDDQVCFSEGFSAPMPELEWLPPPQEASGHA
jgi:hypothetical protein